MTGALESTAAGREDDLAVLERIPLEDRGVPASTYEALVRAAEQWPERPAISCLPDADHWERPSTRTFAELAGDVHRFASVYAGFGADQPCARRRTGRRARAAATTSTRRSSKLGPFALAWECG